MTGETDPARTVLTATHEERGARMGEFAGWLMPIEFAGTLTEHRRVRSQAGVFDVSHLGTLLVRGQGAADALARTVTRDITTLPVGRATYALCCDDSGGIVDDLIVYHVAPGQFVVVPNAANTATVRERLRAAASGAVVEDVTADTAVLAVQGPRALEVAAAVVDVDLSGLEYLDVERVQIGGARGWLARTGYTGERGCELLVPGGTAGRLWEALLAEDAEPCGLGARDTLRLEMGYPLHGNDIDRSTSPYEAGLGWAVDLDREGFSGQPALREAKGRDPARRLWGLEGRSRRPPRAGMDVIHDGREAGVVTSGGFSPTLEIGIGLAYLDGPLGPGRKVAVDVRGREEPFRVVRPPFVDSDPRS